MTTTTTTTTNNLQSLRYSNDDNDNNNKPTLSVLDQLLIPSEKTYIDIHSVEDAWAVIRSMQIRGAPLIAIVASLSLAVDLTTNETTLQALTQLEEEHANNNNNNNGADALVQLVVSKINYLKTSRPTAVNLFHAMDELERAVKEASVVASTTTADSTSPRQRICQALVQHAEFMLQRDVSDNRAIGQNGARAILQKSSSNNNNNNNSHNHHNKITMVTICNTGSLATAGYGTALGVARALQERNALERIIALETRPYNQGSRLTAFEMVEENMPHSTLICDSAVGALMKTSHVDAVVVGADRVCANGDTANKIGTYNLAVVAAAHQVPFYVAAPFTTLDVSLATGDEITIEERPASELLTSSQAPSHIHCWNPAFDVTPAKYIAGIITEKGVIEPNHDGTISVAAFVKQHQNSNAPTAISTSNNDSKESKLQVSPYYKEQTVDSLPEYLAQNAPAAMEALGTTRAKDLSAVEMGDGNLNLVFIVTNTKGENHGDDSSGGHRPKQIIIKQALPYVRCVGEAWPLTLERSYFEYRALLAEKQACPEFVPSLYFFSKTHGLMAMEYIPPPNIILRKGLIQGIRYPTMAADMGTFCAKTLFRTSGFKLSESELRQQVQFWSTNTEMCALTEQVVFTEPYITAANNRWTSPQLDNHKKAIENDVGLKIAAAQLKTKFVTETQALIHADLHSGSVMCSPAPGQTFVIDPEFAFYGPMGFDTGAFLGNLLLAYVSQAGHENGKDYGEWILEQVIVFWKTFQSEFLQLWKDPAEHTGYLYGRNVLPSEETIHAHDGFMQTLLTDTLSFAGMKMLRRIVGIAHVEDLESIADPDVRARCERHALEIAKTMIKSTASFSSIEQVTELAKRLKQP